MVAMAARSQGLLQGGSCSREAFSAGQEGGGGPGRQEGGEGGGGERWPLGRRIRPRESG